MRGSRFLAIFIGLSVLIHVALVGAGYMGLRDRGVPADALTILELETVPPGESPKPKPALQPPPQQPPQPKLKPVPRPRRKAPAARRPPTLDLTMRDGAPLDLNLSRDFERPEPVISAPDGKGKLTTPGNEGAAVAARAAGSGRGTERKIRRMLAADQAGRDLKDGRVSPHLYDLVRAAEGAFRPTWALTRGDRRGLGTVSRSMRTFARELGKNYLRGIKEFMDPPSTRGALDDQETPMALEQYARLRKAAEDGADALRCTFCVELRPGEAPTVHLARPSGKRAFDRLAREAMERAVRLHRQGRGDASVEACYQFTAKFFRVPPLPVVGCQFDEVHLTGECFYPFKNVLRSNVKLVGVRPLTDG